MILDTITNADQYTALHPLFGKGLEFVKEHGATIAAGKYPIVGDELYVTIVRSDLRPANEALLEVHRKYIDIQVVFSGEESYGWSALSDCHIPHGEFDQLNDIGFYDDQHATLVKAHQGQFVIFFPQDAHAPLIGEGRIHKAIIKVKC